MRILFVCLGNICRSPTAEGVMRKVLAEAGAEGEIEVESAGTGSWHVGERADPRAVAAASERGYSLESLGRQVSPSDFEEYDLLLAMDRSNHADLLSIAPPDAREKVRLLREFDPKGGDLDVPDPYYGGHDGFNQVLNIIERSCEELLRELRDGGMAAVETP